ncbi:MAG: hypothetical protein HFH83_04465 [Lachnospiraceae bacterium]|jgi:hypothetical protein|nr:hypothetical protein [Lachnospiraceae bacterium]
MKVYKATGQDLSCHMGRGVFQYAMGEPAEAEKAKCGKEGLHACEYVLDCLNYYGLEGNRFFEAEAEGDIAEDGANTRVSCTRLTLVRELGRPDIAREAIRYMVRHPRREWKHRSTGVTVAEEQAQADFTGGIAIARGREPRVKGKKGSCLGLIREDGERILAARLFSVAGPIRENVWYTIEEAEKAIREGAEKDEEKKDSDSTGKASGKENGRPDNGQGSGRISDSGYLA